MSRHIVVPADETSVTSALIGAPAKPQTAVFVIVDVGGGSNVTNAMATSSVFSPGNNFAERLRQAVVRDHEDGRRRAGTVQLPDVDLRLQRAAKAR